MSSDVEPPNCCPAISATMTAYGRMLLWQIISIAGRDNIIYCDTDGILVNYAGRMRLQKAGWCTGERGGLAVKGLAQWADMCGGSSTTAWVVSTTRTRASGPRPEYHEDIHGMTMAVSPCESTSVSARVSGSRDHWRRHTGSTECQGDHSTGTVT